MTYGYREVRYVGPPAWRRLGPVTRTVLVLTGLGYMAGVFFPAPMALLFAAPSRIAAGEIWRLLTYPAVIPGIFNALFALLLFWSFGTELERDWGSASYGLFLAIATLAAGILGTAVALYVPGAGLAIGHGCSGLLTAVIVGWMLMGPSLPTNLFGVVPLTRKGFALLAVILVAFGELESTRSFAGLVFVLGGLPVAWFWARGRRGRGVRFSLRVPRFLRRRRFRVVKDDDVDREQYH